MSWNSTRHEMLMRNLVMKSGMKMINLLTDMLGPCQRVNP